MCREAGWNQQPADWSRLIAHEPGGCFIAEIQEQIVGTVTTTRYGTDLAWIGMMLVDERFRRRGIATELMEASLSYLREAGVNCIKLDATPAGQPVYERLGFQPEGLFHRWSRDSEASPNWSLSRPSQQLQKSHWQLDQAAFATDRIEWLNRLAEGSHVVTCKRSFGMARPGFLANYVGPVVAENEDEAQLIIDDLLGPISGHTFWDIPPGNLAASTLACSRGFQPVRNLTRMRIGSMPVPPTMPLQFAISDPGTG
ncbi:putative acetyltransferase [Aureliella helgolandensis]|uniref:Putative acetyltransferase n=2 Tax=Aureliella helgolandensis TaxID=2527968 RepID=A0A518GDV3_9BACT|nr:putative acetyltransferase [Aureliella helgolandensis]